MLLGGLGGSARRHNGEWAHLRPCVDDVRKGLWRARRTAEDGGEITVSYKNVVSMPLLDPVVCMMNQYSDDVEYEDLQLVDLWERFIWRFPLPCDPASKSFNAWQERKIDLASALRPGSRVVVLGSPYPDAFAALVDLPWGDLLAQAPAIRRVADLRYLRQMWDSAATSGPSATNVGDVGRLRALRILMDAGALPPRPAPVPQRAAEVAFVIHGNITLDALVSVYRPLGRE
eukprot:gene7234-2520_t